MFKIICSNCGEVEYLENFKFLSEISSNNNINFTIYSGYGRESWEGDITINCKKCGNKISDDNSFLTTSQH